MKKLDLSKVPKDIKPNPLFKGMKESLKDPNNYEDIEARLSEILKTDHKHKTALSYAKCDECQKNREERKNLMKQIGFKSLTQYLEWKKIMLIIINKQNFQLR